MRIHRLIENAFLRIADAVYRRLPQPVPNDDRLKRCKLISHRGDCGTPGVYENTVPAFEAAAAGGTWGIEFDVRWTRDLQPVVMHDGDTRRVFGTSLGIRRSTFRNLRRVHPLIPHLEEVVHAFGGRLHLMVELKPERYPDIVYQRRSLERIFSPLVPRHDYHFISLAPRSFDLIDFAPTNALLPIAQLNIGAMSKMAASKGFGGLLGHYAMITDSIVRKHRERGQATGTGFADSRNCLFREMNRGIDWIFSNRAVAMQVVVGDCLKNSRSLRQPHEITRS